MIYLLTAILDTHMNGRTLRLRWRLPARRCRFYLF